MATELKAHKKEPGQLDKEVKTWVQTLSKTSLSADTRYLICTIFHTISVVPIFMSSFYIPILLRQIEAVERGDQHSTYYRCDDPSGTLHY